MMSSEEENNQWNTDHENWIWGVFYFNKNDRRLFLAKRNSTLGFTVNFANPQTYLFIAALVLLLVLVKNFSAIF